MDVEHYDEQSRTVKRPLYEYYANKIKTYTNVTNGRCLDIGSCGGYLGLELAKITRLHVTFFDLSQEALNKAALHLIEDDLEEQGAILVGDVHAIPLEDEMMDLIISRGSLPFWEDPALAFKEIYRVLKKGGTTFVGGGKGTSEIKEQIETNMRKRGQEIDRVAMDKMHGDGMKRDYDALLKSVGIVDYVIHRADDGIWIQMQK
ncbi:Ubiquinone/menaquinone biosynthesis C-methyltransferase UbiE [Sulfurospirillum diekertiae]|uniref:Ubiquinone/menaquinone biosynthesis C-methyltransferase UbiE n=1 Tax=Sulfurospirillum diekertiae TaxID=1854492 RepID=A0A290HU08_9BACT|nr:class I SAM-dependent methyltransferase [Sulfurospirillum diekertiae]ATB69140.1 Ubiquinone/menaquinone biosynthesis C-methyltransferase UbiE [Sulfurospirillum diekertiae]